MSAGTTIFNGEVYDGKTIVLDGKQFEACRFITCVLVYRGGQIPAISNCNFNECSWEFEEAAGETLVFLAGLMQGGFSNLVEDIFASFRHGTIEPLEHAPFPGPDESRGETAATRVMRQIGGIPRFRIARRAKPGKARH